MFVMASFLSRMKLAKGQRCNIIASLKCKLGLKKIQSSLQNVLISNRNKLTIEFSRADMKEIKEAAQILGCEDNMELFITDAAIYKARRIVEYVNSPHFLLLTTNARKF